VYTVRKLKLKYTEQINSLAIESGTVYRKTLIRFYRALRKKGHWLSSNAMMKLIRSEALHSQSTQAAVQAFYTALDSWREKRLSDPQARMPPRKCKYYRIMWKKSAIKIKDGSLMLSNGKGSIPLAIPWQWDTPCFIEIGWDGVQYELRATYNIGEANALPSQMCAGIDLGEIHLAVSHDGKNCHILNGRMLRSKKQYQNKVKAALQSKTDTKKKGSKRYKRIKKSKAKQLKKIKNQIRDVLHKQTTALVSTLKNEGVQTLVIGDVRNIRQGLDYGSKANQKLHQMLTGKTRHMLTYKAERRNMSVVIVDEKYTTQECPHCHHRYKPSGRMYKCSKCGFAYHRDAVGSFNIRSKYLEFAPVVGVMASPTGIKYSPHMSCVARIAP